MRFRQAAERVRRSISRRHLGKTAGFVFGWCAGWFGAASGLVIGSMIDILLAQRKSDRAVEEYLSNPGPSAFIERVPGAAAFCALCTLVASRGKEGASSGTVAQARVERAAAALFGSAGESRSELETFARASSARIDELNPDLLAESFCARTGSGAAGEAIREAACAALENLGETVEGRAEAERIARIIAPGRSRAAEAARDEPYALLGLRPGASRKEAKAAYRKLAVQLHPDAAAGLSDEQKKSAAEAFMRIDGAYRRITGKA